jgi:hypothetical protein
MCEIIIYRQAEAWLKITLLKPIQLADLFAGPAVEGGIYCAALRENDTEIDCTPLYDEDTIGRVIDSIHDHLLKTGQDAAAETLTDEFQALAKNKKKTQWMFWASLFFVAASTLEILYKTIVLFYRHGPAKAFVISCNIALALFMVFGVTLFIIKKRKQHS